MANDFQSLSQDDQQRVAAILHATGLAKHSQDLPTGMTAMNVGMPETQAINFCKIGCDLAQTAATAACASLSGPAVAEPAILAPPSSRSHTA